MGQTTNGTTVKIDWWIDFDNHIAGEAPAAAIKGRCTKCWGRLTGRLQLDGGGKWTSIECQICGRSVEGEEAVREMESMCREVDNNLPKVCRGLAAKYRKDAKFVLKILPDMDRDKAYFDKRVAAKIAAGRKKNWLSRHDFPKGEAGYLYLQASAFMTGINSLPREMSVIRYSDYDFQEPRISDVDVADDGSIVHVSTETVGKPKQLSKHVLMERMGLLMMSGMTAAFACELALKAILITRLDEARKTHDLLELYRALPEDSKTRLKADFAEIEDELERARHTFGRWRYFETNVGKDGMLALINIERVFALAKAARVIIDEGEIAGLTYEVDINMDAKFRVDNGDTSYREKYDLEVTSGEAAIPWDLLLAAGQKK